MLIKRAADIAASQITDEQLYVDRRQFIRRAAGAGLATAAGMATPWLATPELLASAPQSRGGRAVAGDEKLTSFEAITSYNNFYEFGTAKSDPKEYAGSLRTRPWTLEVDGEVHKPATFDIDDILAHHPREERTYRLRCVEAWSMVVPWLGFPLGDLLKRVEPTSKARFVELYTLHDPEQMPGQRRPILEWPYLEGLRMDEAMHPLAILATGLYGKELLNQNGAPIRLVVPWKYGFKSAKSIVRIRLVEQQPINTWQAANPGEYGFYSNVNPEVDHPRWSQKRERRIGEFLKRKTLPFNGYANEVAHLYRGMDLRRNY